MNLLNKIYHPVEDTIYSFVMYPAMCSVRDSVHYSARYSVWDSVEFSVGVSGYGLVGSKLKEYEFGR